MKIQVWIELGKSGVFHLIQIEERKQVLHRLVFSFFRSFRSNKGTVRWLPKLDELALFSEYFRFLHELCQIKVYPTEHQLECILSGNRITVCDLFFRKEYGLYSDSSEELNLEERTMEELGEILVRSLKQSYMEGKERNGLYFLIASTER